MNDCLTTPQQTNGVSLYMNAKQIVKCFFVISACSADLCQ